MRKAGSAEREEAMQRPVCLLPLLPAILGKWGRKRDRPDTTSLCKPLALLNFSSFSRHIVFYLEGTDR
jgi:hypothetical protein